jgi:hypothetical protein
VAIEGLGREHVPTAARTGFAGLVAAIDRLSWLIVAMAGGICALVVVSTIVGFAPAGRTFADWLTYVHAVERLASGAPIYAPEQLAGPYVLVGVTLYGYAYPPSSVPLFLPFSSYPIGLVLWLTLNAGALLTGLYAILRTELRRHARIEFAGVLVALAFLRGFPEGVAFGNASVAMAGLFAWAWVLGRGRAGVGLFAGIGATVKLVPGVLVFWADRRDVARVFTVTAAVAVGLFLVTLPLVGWSSWLDYARALSLSQPACGAEPPVSLACVLQPLVGVALAKLAGIAIAIVAGIVAVLTRPPLVAFGLLAIAWLAPVTDLHFHYLLVVYVWFVVAGAHWLGRRSPVSGQAEGVSAS